MNDAALQLPSTAECRCLLSDGRVLTVTASRRPRANRADVKCGVAGAPDVAERMRQVVRLARHTEARLDSRDQVVLSMDIAPPAAERDWELAAVLADRIVRGLYQPPILTSGAQAALPAPLYAQGWSDAWHLGKVGACALPAAQLLVERLRGQPAATLILGGDAATGTAAGDGAAPHLLHILHIRHLGALTGHADPSAAVSTVRTWFPLHSGGVNDTLAWVEVSIFPISLPGREDHVEGEMSATAVPDTAEEDSIAAPGLDMGAQQDVRLTLAGARHFDGHGLGRWRSVVRFSQQRFQGASYQLALVMADRLARGREFVPRGRIIATGCSSAWHAGRVDTVEGREPKLALIIRQAAFGDRVLLPKAWLDELPDGFAAALRERGASLACIDRIGML